MGQPSAEWIAEQRAAEAAMLERFANLHDVLVRSDRRIEHLDVRAAVLRTMPNGDPAQVEQEAKDLRQLVAIATHHLANLDRVHLLEEPVQRKRLGYGR